MDEFLIGTGFLLVLEFFAYIMRFWNFPSWIFGNWSGQLASLQINSKKTTADLSYRLWRVRFTLVFLYIFRGYGLKVSLHIEAKSRTSAFEKDRPDLDYWSCRQDPRYAQFACQLLMISSHWTVAMAFVGTLSAHNLTVPGFGTRFSFWIHMIWIDVIMW